MHIDDRRLFPSYSMFVLQCSRPYCLKKHEIWSIDSQKKILKLLPPDVSFKGQNAPKSVSAGVPPQTPLGELTALPQTPYLYLRGPTSKGREGEGKGRGGRERGREREGEPKGRERGGKGEGLQAPQCGILATPLHLLYFLSTWWRRRSCNNVNKAETRHCSSNPKVMQIFNVITTESRVNTTLNIASATCNKVRQLVLVNRQLKHDR